MPWGLISDAAAVLFVLWFVKKNKAAKPLRCILETICFALALVLSVPLSNLLAAVVYSVVFREPLAKDISSVVEQAAALASPGQTDHISGLLAKLPSAITNASQSYDLIRDENVTAISRIIVSSSQDRAEQIVDILAGPVIQGIFRAVFCVILFTGLQYLLKAAASLVENAMYSPERVEENVVLCGVLGAIKGIVVLGAVLCAARLIIPALPQIPGFSIDLLDGSTICALLYENNPLLVFLGADIYPLKL